VAVQQAYRAHEDRRVIALDFRLDQGTFVLEMHEALEGRVTAIVGHSGAGKTTALDAIAGLRRPSSGTIAVDGRTLFSSESGINIPVHRRRVGYLTQDVSLFPHRSVRSNVLYGRRDGQRLSLDAVVGMLEIEPLLDRGVSQLSGGERQRVALARALMSSPGVLLLDEPLAAVDVELRRRIIPYLERVRDELSVPIVYVTHAREEVKALADYVILLERGRVRRSGPASEVLRSPLEEALTGT
jgi:molybdate transport system ATP-binding protein